VQYLASVFDPLRLNAFSFRNYATCVKNKCALNAQWLPYMYLHSSVNPTLRTQHCDIQKFNPLKCVTRATG